MPVSHLATDCVHAGHANPRPHGAAVVPLVQCSVFTQEVGADYHDIVYPRHGNLPTQIALAAKAAALEGGEAALLCSSGMAAITSTLLHLLRGGGHLLIQETLYGGTLSFVTHNLRDFGMDCDLIDPDAPESWQAKLRPATRAIFTEAIANPTMAVADHPAVVEFAQEHGLTAVIDATFATPVHFQPLRMGYHIALHSATKYLNGHSDLVAGIAVGSRETIEAMGPLVNRLGSTLDPHSAFLVDRGIKTLPLRVQRQSENALALAHFLEGHQRVTAVHYPGLQSSPFHERARELFKGFGGMLAFEARGGDAALRCAQNLQLALHATSLGGTETLVSLPRYTSHAEMGAEERARLGIADGLVRVSCGIEHPDDLIADFAQALEA